MESSTTSVLTELAQVHELAMKLGAYLHQPSQFELCRTTAEEILFSVEKAICMAKSTGAGGGGSGESPFSNNRGEHDDHQQMSKRRKMLPKWTSHVSESTLGGSEGFPDDGHNWRKYGQKDILNAKHPRAYYRCTHRKTRGCLAMKQVQRSDDNPLVFEVTYRGTHTCFNMVQQTGPGSHHFQDPHQSLFDQPKSRTLVDLQNSLRVKTESSEFEAQDATSLFIFPSTTLNPKDNLFCSSPNLESCFLGSLSSAFMSPTTSESNCIPWSPCQKNSHGNPKPDLTDIISMETYVTSVTNSTMMDVNFMLKTGEMDTNFPIETCNFFEWNPAA